MKARALGDLWVFFQQRVFKEPSTATLFNQYVDVDPRFDLDEADRIRQENLHNYLASFSDRPRVLLVGEAPGPWGCRFSGVPFTSEAQLVSGTLPFRGRRSSRQGEPHDERTARLFWKVIAPYHARVFVWNCVPFHPHLVGKPLTIRPPKASEEIAYAPILRELYRLLQPGCVISVGGHAERTLSRLRVPSHYVRHPSRGADQFRKGMGKLFGRRISGLAGGGRRGGVR